MISKVERRKNTTPYPLKLQNLSCLAIFLNIKKRERKKKKLMAFSSLLYGFK